MMKAIVNLEDLLRKDVFTTGEVAQICKVSQQTIIRCFDNGLLKGYRVPGSRFRKIPKSGLLDFVRENNLAGDLINGFYLSEIFVLSDSNDLFNRLHASLAHSFNVLCISCSFEAGVLFAQGKILLIDGSYASRETVQGMLDSISQVDGRRGLVFLINNLSVFDIPRGVFALDQIPKVDDITQRIYAD